MSKNDEHTTFLKEAEEHLVKPVNGYLKEKFKGYKLTKRDMYPLLAGGVTGFVFSALGSPPQEVIRYSLLNLGICRILQNDSSRKAITQELQTCGLDRERAEQLQVQYDNLKKESNLASVLAISSVVAGGVIHESSSIDMLIKDGALGLAVGYSIGYVSEIKDKLKEPLARGRQWLRRHNITNGTQLQQCVEESLEKGSPEYMQKYYGFPKNLRPALGISPRSGRFQG
jgi:hypothetical protein